MNEPGSDICFLYTPCDDGRNFELCYLGPSKTMLHILEETTSCFTMLTLSTINMIIDNRPTKRAIERMWSYLQPRELPESLAKKVVEDFKSFQSYLMNSSILSSNQVSTLLPIHPDETDIQVVYPPVNSLEAPLRI